MRKCVCVFSSSDKWRTLGRASGTEQSATTRKSPHTTKKEDFLFCLVFSLSGSGGAEVLVVFWAQVSNELCNNVMEQRLISRREQQADRRGEGGQGRGKKDKKTKGTGG